MDALRAPKGVIEYLPPDSADFAFVRDQLLGSAARAGYGLVELPIFEDTALYVRGVGESTDVVSKEMYTFDDRGGRSLSLRPEGTAGVVRAAIEHNLDRISLPVKLSYAGPFFRAERPQQGRYRQFSQVGIEAIGSDDPALDAEVIAVAVEGFRALGLTGFRLLINSLGDLESRAAYRDVLTKYLETLDLDEATRERAKLNPLRVLDDKREAVQAQLRDAPLMSAVLSPESLDHQAAVGAYLTALGVDWESAPRLVRGLDYYTRTTFEFVHEGLGAQSAIGGGGRYDGLVEQLGGAALPGIGFGLGIDRTLLACRAEGIDLPVARPCDVFVIPAGADNTTLALEVCAALRGYGFATEMAWDGRSIKGAMRAANRSGALFSVILDQPGSDLASAMLTVKDMAAGEQTTISFDDLLIKLRTD